MSDIGDTDDSASDELEQKDASKLRTCTGLLKSYHGVAYQIQWLMIVAIEAKKRGKVNGFWFRTEVDYEDSGKFDDVVWEYYCVHEMKFKYNFLQAKHKLNEHERIGMKDLKAVKNPFGLKKYYVSYQDSIKNNKKYKNGLIENLIIATNIDFDDELKQILKKSQINIPLLHNILESEECRRPSCWKIDPNVHEDILSSIVDILGETHDLIKLAKMLEDLIFNDKEFTIPEELQEYSYIIFKNLLTIDCTKISTHFIEHKNVSSEVAFLREAFFYVAFVKKRRLFDDGITDPIGEISDYNIEDFTSYFASKINDAQVENKLVKIRLSRKSKNYESYNWNIKKLSNFVLIKKDGIKFNPKFWTQKEIESSKYFKLFKIKLKCKLIEYGVIGLEDSNKEICEKLDSYRFQITNFTTCMMHLVDENSFWEVVKDYKTRVSKISNQCDSTLKTLPNYSLHEVREDIHIFFSILVFAVNFTKTDLNEVVEDNFNESFRWIDNEFTAYAFRSEISNALDLTQGKIISNAEEVTQFFNKVEEETNRLILIGPSLEYCTKIKLYDIEFKSDVINVPSLNYFINYDELMLKAVDSKEVVEYDNLYKKQVLCYKSKHLLLSSIKVYHLLKNTVKYAFQRNYIFMRLDSIIYLNEYVMKVFEKSVCLLIIECNINSKYDDLRKICKKIIKILRSHAEKKVLLITQENNSLTTQLKHEFSSSYCEIVDPEVNFSNLEERTQIKMLQNYKIFFQGKESSVGSIINDPEYSIDSEILCHYLNNNRIEICNQFLIDDNVIDFYVSREIICRKKVTTKVLKEESTDLYAFSNIKLNDFMNIATRYTTSETNIASKIRKFDKIDFRNVNNVKFVLVDDDLQYKILWEDNKYSNVHWLVKENDYFKWNGTKGSLSNIRPYMRPRKYYSDADSEIIHEFKNNRIVIITADPGMGKSTLIKYLALKLKNEFPLLWVLVIDLGKFRCELKNIKLDDKQSVINFLITVVDFKILKKIKEKIQRRKIIDWFCKNLGTKDFVNEMKINGTDFLEIFLFYNKLHYSGEVYILFDGFDEVCPKYEVESTYLIKVLKKYTMAHIWTTCRTYNIINTLEDNLEIISYGIKSFNESDQELFLLKYWKSKLNFDYLDENRTKIFIQTLLLEFSKATNDTKRTFVGIPLQIQMLARNHLIMFKEFYESGVLTLNDDDKVKIKKGLNLVNLYDEFINIKFHEIRFKEKKYTWPSDDEDIERMIEKCRQDFINEHQILSIYILYAERRELCSEIIKSKALILLPKIREADDKNAIVCGVIGENPVFVHQTYAEYFASLFLWNKFQSVGIEEFRNNFMPNMLNGIFFPDERLQVCKFFYFMADKYFNENIKCVYKGNEDIKMASILRQLLDTVFVIYDSYENHGISSEGIDDVIICPSHSIFDFTLRYSREKQDIVRVFKQNPQFAQVVKLMFYIVESYLTTNKSNHVIIKCLEKYDSINALKMASEIGCINLVKTFLSVNYDYDFKKCLRYSKWYFSPVWLAARNGHLDVLKQLSLKIDKKWPDKDNRNLAQRAYNLPEYNVLRSCLLLNIIDAYPYSDLNNIQTLPLVQALQNVWPLNLIQIIIDKTDSNIFNNFVCDNNFKASIAICNSLLKYETCVVNLMIEKGIHFFGALNVLLFEFTRTSLYDPINLMKYKIFHSPSFHDEQDYLNLYGLIETLLHSGVGYNSFDDVHSITTSKYSKQVYYMHQLFMYISDYKVSTTDDKVYLLLKFILSAATDEFEIIKSSDRSLRLRLKHSKCSTAKRKRTNTALEHCCRTWPKSYSDGIDINLLSDEEILYSLGKTEEVIENSLTNVSKYMEKACVEIKQFRKYQDNKLYNNIFIAYEEMLQYRFKNDVSKNTLFKSLPHFEKCIFKYVLDLYIRQDYEILDAFSEVSRNLWRWRMIKEWLQEKSCGCVITYEEIINIFGLNLDNETNEATTVHYQISKTLINIMNSGALQQLLCIWEKLNYVGKNNFQKVTKSMSKYEQISLKIFDLFNKLDAYYNSLINAIKSGEPKNLLEVLKNIEITLVKSVVNAQDCEYDSPLHYAVFVGNVEIVRILLEHGADPNQALQCNSKLLADSNECFGLTPQDIAREREYLNPEVYRTIINILILQPA